MSCARATGPGRLGLFPLGGSGKGSEDVQCRPVRVAARTRASTESVCECVHVVACVCVSLHVCMSMYLFPDVCICLCVHVTGSDVLGSPCKCVT